MKQVIVGSAVAALTFGCGSNAVPLQVGVQDGGDGVSSPPPDGGGRTFNVADGSVGFMADIEGPNHVVLTTAALNCDDGCIDVKAVTQGGNAPFTYKWSDGMTGASRHFCPKSTTTVSVSVTDSGRTGEITAPPQTVTASLTLSCSDAGVADGGSSECLSNPSFEQGTPANVGGTAPPWVICDPMNNAGFVSQALSGVAIPTPTDGNNCAFFNVGGVISEPMCATMQAGTEYNLLLDLASVPSLPGAAPSALKIFGGSSSCSQGELLWSSPPTGQAYRTFCATMKPTHDTTFLTLAIYTPSDAGIAIPGYLVVDTLVSVASCF